VRLADRARPARRWGLTILAPAGAVVVLLGIWELYVDLGFTDALVLPAPHSVASALWSDRGTLWSNFLVTAKEVVLGILLGVAIAWLLALAIHRWRLLRAGLYPLLVASQAIPIVLIAPLVVVWLGFGLAPKLAIIALVTFFPVVVTTLAGLRSIDGDLIKLMRTFGAGRGQILRHVEIPAALPGLFTGARLAAVLSVIGAVFAEQSGANSGLGVLFTVADGQDQAVPEAFAAVVVLAGFAIALFLVLSLAERWVLPWAYHARR
jgi:putative hydroxymethylpyrimidine transport system permease protein